MKFTLPPSAFARMMKSVLGVTADKNGQPPRYPYLLVHAERDNREGTLSVAAMSRCVCARDWAPIMGVEGDEAAELLLPGLNPAKTDVVDDLHKLAMAVSKTSSAAAARVFVTVHHQDRLTVEYAGQLVGELAHVVDPHPLPAHMWGQLDDWLDADDLALAGPTAFMLDTLGRLTKVAGTVADLAAVPDLDGAVRVAIGPTFRALVSTVNRPLYTAGGPWGDGPGAPDHLLTGLVA